MLFLPLFALISSVSSVPLQVQSEPAHNAAGYDTSLTLNTPGARCTRQTYDIAVETEISLFQNFDSNANQTILTAQLLDYVTSLPAARCADSELPSLFMWLEYWAHFVWLPF